MGQAAASDASTTSSSAVAARVEGPVCGGAPAGSADAERLVAGLGLTVFLQWLGASALVPLLPEFVRARGGTDALAGAVMAAFFAAGVVGQYPAGRAADRIGRRGVLLFGLVLYGLASLAFLAPVPPGAYVGLRALQGLGAGAVEVAALAMASASVAGDRRGRAFASIYAGQVAGMAVGPLVGSVVGVGLLWTVFLGSGAASLAACVPGAATGRVAAAPPTGSPRAPAPLRLGRAVLGCVIAAATLGLTTGVYETCWTLLLHHRGAANWEVGLSWTLFAVPFVLMARPSGWLADHLDRRRLAVIGLAISTVMCAGYPFIPVVAPLVVLGVLEAVGVAIALPAAQSLLASSVDASAHGRAQGIFATAQTAATAVSAGAGGVLFGLAPFAPFVAVAAAGGLLLAATAAAWATVPGRAAGPLAEPAVT